MKHKVFTSFTMASSAVLLFSACDDGPVDPNLACKNLAPEIIELMQENGTQATAFTNHKYMVDENGNMVIPNQSVVPGKVTVNCQADAQLSIGTAVPVAYYKSLGDGLDLHIGYEVRKTGYDCTSLRPEIIALTEEDRATNGFALVQIYEPQTLSDNEDKLECQGRAFWSDQDETMINYTAFRDIEGDVLISYEIPQN